jgi:hypothetical protein
MKYIIAFFLSLILPIISLKQNNPKLCINCKHFIPDNDGDNKYGKCSLFPRSEGLANFLVTGINKDEYQYCSTVRISDSLCSREGNYYKKKYIKKNLLNEKKM